MLLHNVSSGAVLTDNSVMQAWAAMEEEIGALQRATELRSYRMQGINDVVLPANFGISLSQEPADSPLKAVANTVCFDTSSLPIMLLSSYYKGRLTLLLQWVLANHCFCHSGALGQVLVCACCCTARCSETALLASSIPPSL